MTRVDEQAFATFMAMLGTAFERGDLTTTKIEMYFDFLSDLDIRAIEKATREIIRFRKYPTFPTIAEIREAALGSDAEAEDEALIAWGKATRLISAGRRADDERINEAIVLAFGSWDRFGETNPEMEASDRKHFIACYKVAARKRREHLALNGGVEVKRLAQEAQS